LQKSLIMTKLCIVIGFLLGACTSGDNKSGIENAKKEIMQTEQNFEAMAKEKGLSAAFSFYADSAATLSRGSYLIHGKDSIRLFYLSPKFHDVKLEWKPDFVEVSNSADLGYTYGPYTFTSLDSAGQSISTKGYFHTVWKKRPDGNWKFVWD